MTRPRIFGCVGGWLASLACFVDLGAQIKLPDPLRGVFTVSHVGQGPKVFRSLDVVGRYLSLAGITGDVEIVVEPGVYKGSMRFFSIPGQKPGQKILIRASESGKVQLESDTSIIQIVEGAHDLIFDGLAFGASGSAPTIAVKGSSQDIEIRNCHFTKGTGGSKVIEVQGERKASGFDIHHNHFESLSGSYGIYTQATANMLVHHNDFHCAGVGEVISIWNSNKSQSRIYDNVFRGRISRTGIRLNVSGHDVDVTNNLFLLKSSTAVIGSRGLRNTAWNRIHHNLFVVLGEGPVFTSSGSVAINHNSYAVESGTIGKIGNAVAEDFDSWRESLAAVAVDDQADQDSALANRDFFTKHSKLLTLFHDFEKYEDAEEEPKEAVVPKKSVPIDPLVNEKEAARTALRKRLQYLIGLLNEPDVVVQRLAIRVLRDMGKSAAPAVAALGRLCDHPHAPVRADAAEALGVIRIGAEIVIPELLRLLGDKDIYVLLPAIQTLAKFTHLARQAEPDLRRLLEHSDEAVKAAAKAALAVIVEKD